VTLKRGLKGRAARSLFIVCSAWSVYALLGCRSEPPQVAKPVAERPSPLRDLSVAWGRVTCGLWESSTTLWTGHETGWIARWEAKEGEPQTLTSRASWLGHEGAVRQLNTLAGGGVESLGGDASWVSWSRDGRALSRGRAPQLKANDGARLKDGSWLIASDRGTVTRVLNGERVWRTAGEHRRAAFALSVTGDELLSVGADGWLRRWDAQSGHAIGGRAAHQGWATSLLKLTPPRSLQTTPVWVTGGSDGVVRAWPSDVAHAQIEAPPVEGARGHRADLTRLAGSWPWVVSGGEDGRLSLYSISVAQGHPQVTHLGQLVAFKRGPVMSLTRRGDCVLAGGGQVARDVALACVEGSALRMKRLTLLATPRIE